MALAFRNLAITPDAPVSEWPTEAVQTALERGDLADWHRIVAEIGTDPWGRTARQVEAVLSHSRPYGVAEAMETALSRARPRSCSGSAIQPTGNRTTSRNHEGREPERLAGNGIHTLVSRTTAR
jgi:hypothetical protein